MSLDWLIPVFLAVRPLTCVKPHSSAPLSQRRNPVPVKGIRAPEVAFQPKSVKKVNSAFATEVCVQPGSSATLRVIKPPVHLATIARLEQWRNDYVFLVTSAPKELEMSPPTLPWRARLVNSVTKDPMNPPNALSDTSVLLRQRRGSVLWAPSVHKAQLNRLCVRLGISAVMSPPKSPAV